MAIAGGPLGSLPIAGSPPVEQPTPRICDCILPNTARACFIIVVNPINPVPQENMNMALYTYKRKVHL